MKYRVHLVAQASTSVEVEADSYADAVILALEEAEPAEAPANVDFDLPGEWEPYSGTDENGNTYQGWGDEK